MMMMMMMMMTIFCLASRGVGKLAKGAPLAPEKVNG